MAARPGISPRSFPRSCGETYANPTRTPSRSSLPEFFERVQQRAAVDLQTANVGVSAVLDTLRDAVSAKEYEDSVAQLPKEFWQLTGPAATRMEPRRIGT